MQDHGDARVLEHQVVTFLSAVVQSVRRVGIAEAAQVQRVPAFEIGDHMGADRGRREDEGIGQIAPGQG